MWTVVETKKKKKKKKSVYAKQSIQRNSVYRCPFLTVHPFILKGEKSDVAAQGCKEAERSEYR